MVVEDICSQLKARFGEAVAALSATKGDRFVVVKGEKVVEICRFLKTTAGLDFDYCQDITALDWPARKVIEVVYHLYSLQERHGIVLKVETDREQPSVASVAGVWQAATWLEREIFDLFGVFFTGHADLRRILLPDDWVGHPLRKDYQEAGGYHGIENVRPNPLVQLAKVTEEKRKAVAAAAAAAAPKPDAVPATATATATTTATTTTTAKATAPATAPPAGTSGPTPPPPAPLAPLAPSTATDSAPSSASAPSPSPEEK